MRNLSGEKGAPAGRFWLELRAKFALHRASGFRPPFTMDKITPSAHGKRSFDRCAISGISLLLLIVPAQLRAAPLQEARVTQVIKDVKLLPNEAAPRPAAVNDQINARTAVRTGADSRTELTFSDFTIARLGANTIFSVNEGTRTIDLGGGAILVRVPKNSGGAKISTAAVTAAITGTTMMAEYHKDQFKFIMLEGSAQICRTGASDCAEINPGQMLAGRPGQPLNKPV
ncbi:MAG: FecR family protein, partial [Verrucomicrobiota bacterium]|nr:FecR family protein [Verrucomicrobiota bacterium]